MKSTIGQKFEAGRAQYDNLAKSYANQINKLTGRNDGADFLIDYGGAFPVRPGSGAGGGATLGPNVVDQIVTQGGVRYKVSTDAKGNVIKSEVIR
jgi:hypothetical protein